MTAEYVTKHQSEQLYARGWRSEKSPLDGPRAVLETSLGIYATIRNVGAAFAWDIWSDGTGIQQGYGRTQNVVEAADAVDSWIKEHWA